MAAIVILLALQVVTIVLVFNIRAMVAKSPKGPIAAPSVQPPRADDKRNDMRGGRRGAYEHPKPREEHGPAAVPVDRSLRDINLRLKTAEKSQERARQEVRGVISQTGSGSGGSQGHQGPRDDGPRRRDDRRGSRSDGNRGPRPQGQGGPNQISRPQAFAPRTDIPPSPPTQSSPKPPEIASPAVSVELKGDVEHGRRFMVKRRTLDDSPDSAQAGNGQNGGDTAQTNPAPVSNASISFGRK